MDERSFSLSLYLLLCLPFRTFWMARENTQALDKIRGNQKWWWWWGNLLQQLSYENPVINDRRNPEQVDEQMNDWMTERRETEWKKSTNNNMGTSMKWTMRKMAKTIHYVAFSFIYDFVALAWIVWHFCMNYLDS